MKELIEELARRIKAGEDANDVSGEDLDVVWQFCEAQAINRLAGTWGFEETIDAAMF